MSSIAQPSRTRVGVQVRGRAWIALHEGAPRQVVIGDDGDPAAWRGGLRRGEQAVVLLGRHERVLLAQGVGDRQAVLAVDGVRPVREDEPVVRRDGGFKWLVAEVFEVGHEPKLARSQLRGRRGAFAIRDGPKLSREGVVVVRHLCHARVSQAGRLKCGVLGHAQVGKLDERHAARCTGRLRLPDDSLVRAVPVPHRALHEPLEEMRRGVARPAVEAELELAQVPLEVLARDRALVGAEHPPLEQGEHAVDGRQDDVRLQARAVHNLPNVGVARPLQVGVASPAVRADGGLKLQPPRHERGELGLGAVLDHREPHPPHAALGLLDGAGDDGLLLGPAPALAVGRAADVGLVHLHLARQRGAARVHHAPAELLEPRPGGLVRAEAQLPLKLLRAQPLLARHHEVQGEEPDAQPLAGAVEGGARRDRVLVPATVALVDRPRHQGARAPRAAAVADESLRPLLPRQVVGAGFFRAELREERGHGLREVALDHCRRKSTTSWACSGS